MKSRLVEEGGLKSWLVEEGGLKSGCLKAGAMLRAGLALFGASSVSISTTGSSANWTEGSAELRNEDCDCRLTGHWITEGAETGLRMGVSPVGLVITRVSPVGLVVSWVGELAVTEGDKLCLSIVILLPGETGLIIEIGDVCLSMVGL